MTFTAAGKNLRVVQVTFYIEMIKRRPYSERDPRFNKGSEKR